MSDTQGDLEKLRDVLVKADKALRECCNPRLSQRAFQLYAATLADIKYALSAPVAEPAKEPQPKRWCAEGCYTKPYASKCTRCGGVYYEQGHEPVPKLSEDEQEKAPEQTMVWEKQRFIDELKATIKHLRQQVLDLKAPPQPSEQEKAIFGPMLEHREGKSRLPLFQSNPSACLPSASDSASPPQPSEQDWMEAMAHYQASHYAHESIRTKAREIAAKRSGTCL